MLCSVEIGSAGKTPVFSALSSSIRQSGDTGAVTKSRSESDSEDMELSRVEETELDTDVVMRDVGRADEAVWPLQDGDTEDDDEDLFRVSFCLKEEMLVVVFDVTGVVVEAWAWTCCDSTLLTETRDLERFLDKAERILDATDFCVAVDSASEDVYDLKEELFECVRASPQE